MDVLKRITEEFGLKEEHAKNVVALLDEGNTIPFIARYRKEMTSMGQPLFFWRFGAACRARTCARPVMSRMLWPTELKQHKKNQLCCMELIMQKAGF